MDNIEMKLFNDVDFKIGVDHHDAFKRLLENADFKLFRQYVESKLIKACVNAVVEQNQELRHQMTNDAAGASLLWKHIMFLMESLQKREKEIKL
jgi:hypothetical protein